MKLRPKTTISEHFSDLEDPRVDRTKLHKLLDIVTITICAVICGAPTWVDIESYGQSKYKWLKKFLELPNGIPSHDNSEFLPDLTQNNYSHVFSNGFNLSVRLLLEK